jgi:hypothetical protein
MFKRNEGILDRTVRVALGLVFLPSGLFWLGGVQGNVPGLVAAGFGTWILITGLIGFCPLYIPLGINTLEKEKELFARCMTMMSTFRQGSTSSRQPAEEQTCGPCPPSIGKTHHQQE